MKKITIVVAGLLLCMESACAWGASGARALFQRIDTNNDRKLEFNEIQAARADLFDRIDANRNGVLDPDEIRAAGERAKARRNFQSAQVADFRAQANHMDLNRDGKISRDEFSGFIPDRLQQADKDGDSALSISELRTLRRQ
jgi:hypothetical protein